MTTLDTQTLLESARRRTGLQDFGDPPVEPAFSALVTSLNREAELHLIGRSLMKMHLRELLETRLRLVAFWKKNEARLEAERIKKPVFIVGMPRSGSTYLHELLAENPGYRAPRVWEIMYPLGFAGGDGHDEARRIRKAGMCLWWFRRLVPRAEAVYPVRARTPHECVAIHSYTLLSEEFTSTCRVPMYGAFLHRADLGPVYAWQKRFLQHLQLGHPEKRWVLKSADHVYGIEQLLAVFPDAYIIQTHRNPVEVLKSTADLTLALRGLYSRANDLETVRAKEARALAERLERFMQFRDSHPELARRIIDVKYTDLTADPMAEVRRLCEGVSTPMTELMTERVRHLASCRSRYRGPRASAQKVSLGLDRMVGARFERYCSRFGLPFRKADVCH